MPNANRYPTHACLAACFALGLIAEAHAQPPARQVLRESQQRVVKVFGAGGLSGIEAYQTGLIVSPEGHIATVDSAVLVDGGATIVTIDGARRHGEVVGADPLSGVALLKVDPAGEALPAFDLSAAPEPRRGDPVWALANLFGISAGEEPVSVLRATVAAVAPLDAHFGVEGRVRRPRALLLDAVTSNPGAPGGAVVDLRGGLVGMLGREVGAAATGAWVSHALPAAELEASLNRIRSGVELSAGATASTATDSNTLAAWGFALVPALTPRTPPFVDYVQPEGPAAAAGLRSDDLIVMVDGLVTATCQEFHRVAVSRTERPAVTITAQRADGLLEIKITTSINALRTDPEPTR